MMDKRNKRFFYAILLIILVLQNCKSKSIETEQCRTYIRNDIGDVKAQLGNLLKDIIIINKENLPFYSFDFNLNKHYEIVSIKPDVYNDLEYSLLLAKAIKEINFEFTRDKNTCETYFSNIVIDCRSREIWYPKNSSELEMIIE